MKTLLLAMLLASTAFAGETVLETSVYFDTGKAVLTSESKAVLDNVAKSTQATDTVVAIGTADVRPFRASSNTKLGLARANAVKDYLVSHGVPAEVITTDTVGDAKAKATKKMGAEALAKDRRVDIKVFREECPPPAVVLVQSPAPIEAKILQGEGLVLWNELKPVKPDPWYRLMGHAAVGVGARVPHWSGLLGLRAHFPKVRLGAEAYTAFSYGMGLQGMVYPYQGEKLNWHVNLGVLGFGNRYVSTQDVPRPWDLTLGTGVEYRFHKHFAFAADWRWAIPSPIFVAQHGWPKFDAGTKVLGPDGRYLDVKQVLGNSFTESHLMLGLLFY